MALKAEREIYYHHYLLLNKNTRNINVIDDLGICGTLNTKNRCTGPVLLWPNIANVVNILFQVILALTK